MVLTEPLINLFTNVEGLMEVIKLTAGQDMLLVFWALVV